MDEKLDNPYQSPVTGPPTDQTLNRIHRKRVNLAFACLLLIGLSVMIYGLFGRMPFGPSLSDTIESIGIRDDPAVIDEKFHRYRESQRQQAYNVMVLGGVLVVLSAVGLLATKGK